jgi:enterobacterial common antigen flippase
MKLLSSSILTAATALLVTAASFVSGVVLARVLGPEGRGQYAIVLLVVTLTSGLAQLGLGQSFVYTSRQRGVGARRWVALASMSAIAAVALLLACGLALTLGGTLSSGLIAAAVALSIVQAVNTFSANALQISGDARDYNLARAVPVVASLGVVAVLALLGELHVDSAVWATGAATLVAALLAAGLLLFGRRLLEIYHHGPLESGWLSSYLGYGVKCHGTIVLGILVQNLDKLALTFLSSAQQFGVYAVAYNTSRFVGIFQESVSAMLYSRFAGQSVDGLGRATRTAFELTFVPVLTLAMLVGGAGFWLVPLIYGKAYTDASLLFLILTVECVVGGASWLLAQRFQAAGRPGLVFLRQLVSLVPVFASLAFVHHAAFPVILAGSLLASAVLRLVLTLAIYRVVFDEELPRLMANMKTYSDVLQRRAGNTR